MLNRKLLGVFFVSCILLTHNLQAEFINGLETFDGTVKDTDTWYEHMLNPGPSRVFQDDDITLDFNGAEYVTKNVTVGVGQIVSVDLTNVLESPIAHAGKGSSLWLTTNDKNYELGNYFDSAYIFIEYTFSFELPVDKSTTNFYIEPSF